MKIQNPEKEYPSNMGQKWTDEEEALLLEELNKNIDIETISQTHNRTIGGINSRRREIAYKMYLKNVSMEEIIKQTILDDECIRQTIEKRQNNNSKKPISIKSEITEIKKPISIKSEITEIKKPISIKSEITEMKNEIKELKNTIKELVEMMKAVYEFEDA
jgi:HAMP domain-containing protein